MDIDQAIGKAIRQVRLAKGLTQEDFSEVSSRTYVGRLEGGKKSVTVKKLNDLADHMGVPVHEILSLAYLYLNPELGLNGLVSQTLADLPSYLDKSCLED